MPCRIVGKCRKSLKRSRKKRIKPRGTFKARGSNPFKKYRRKRTDEEIMQFALRCRDERLVERTRAEMALASGPLGFRMMRVRRETELQKRLIKLLATEVSIIPEA